MIDRRQDDQWQQWLQRLGAGTQAALQGLDPALADRDRQLAWMDAQREWLAAMDSAMAALAADLRTAGDWPADICARLAALQREIHTRLETAEQQLPPDLQWLAGWFRSPEGTSRDGMADTVVAGFRQWPALGLTGQQARRVEALQTALVRALDALCDYNLSLRAMLDQALANWQRTLLRRTSTNPPDHSELLDTWLSALGEAHEAMLESDEHTVRLATANAAVQQVRREAVPLLEPWFRGLGLATRKDLAGTQQRMLELRRQQDSEIRALRDELRALRQESVDRPRGGRRR